MRNTRRCHYGNTNNKFTFVNQNDRAPVKFSEVALGSGSQSPASQDSKGPEAPKKSNSEQFIELYKDPASKEQKQLSPGVIRMLLEVSSEMNGIDDLLDTRCYALHKDEKLDCFSEVFQKIIEENEDMFSTKSALEKSEILFNFHFHATTSPVIQSEKFSSLVNSFFQKLRDSCKTEETKEVITSEARTKLKERMINLHSVYVRLAIANALKISFKDIHPLSFSNSKSEELMVKASPAITDIYS